jgi:uncharacterized protein YegL
MNCEYYNRTYSKESFYILLDCSASMGTETLAEIQKQIQYLRMRWLFEPDLIERGHISLIAFDSHVRHVFPLTWIYSKTITTKLEMPLIAQGTSSLGAALQFLDETINREIKKTTQDRKGDLHPYTIIITDAQPTDQWQEPLRKFVKKHYHKPIFAIPAHIEETRYTSLKVYYSSLVETEYNKNKIPSEDRWPGMYDDRCHGIMTQIDYLGEVLRQLVNIKYIS